MESGIARYLSPSLNLCEGERRTILLRVVDTIRQGIFERIMFHGSPKIA